MIGGWVARLAGADAVQWRLLTRVMLRTDFRSSNALHLGNTAKKKSGLPWPLLLLYAVMGMWMAMVAGTSPDLLLVTTLVLVAAGIMVALSILIDFHSVVLSPHDYRVLAPQPVTSATYLAARVTSILIYTGVMGGLIGGPAAAVFLVRHGLPAGLGLALALAGTVLWTVLALVIAYASLINRIHPRRLRLALSSLQLVLMTALMAGPIVGPQLAEILEDTGYQAGPVVFLFPWGWFAGLPSLLSGDWSPAAAGGLLAGLATLALLWRHARTRISLSAARRLDNLTSSGEAGSRAGRRSLWSRVGSPEQQAVATLIRAQFRSDMNFRLAVLSIVPITAIYLLMAVRQGPLPDPVLQGAAPGGRLFLIHLLTVFIPLTLMDSLVRSESSAASWIFFAAPASRPRLIVGSGLCVSRLFVAPYAVLLAGIFLWNWGDPGHALIHAAAIGLMAHLVVQLRVLQAPRLPFSEGHRRGTALNQMVTVAVAALIVSVILPPVFGLAYMGPYFTGAFIALLILAAFAFPRVVERAVRARVERLEFGG